MGGGSGGGNISQSSTTSPWPGQIPYLMEAYKGAQDLYYQGGPQYWQYDVTAPLSNATRTSNQLGRDYISNTFYPQYDDLQRAQSRNMSANRIAQMQGEYYRNLPAIVGAGAQDYYGKESQLNPYASGIYNKMDPQQLAQSEAVQRVQNDLGLGTSIQGINQAWQTPGVGIGVDYLNQANQLTNVNNPFLGAMGEAATRDMVRQYQEKILPGISQDAIGSGQFGGSRQAIAEGIAARGASENIADALAELYGNAYGQNVQAQTQRLGQGLQYLQGTSGQNLDYLQQGRGLAAGFYGDMERAAQERALQGSQSMAQFGLGLGGLAGQRYGTNVGTWADIANQQASNSLDQQFRFASIAPQTLQAGMMPSDIYARIGQQHDARAQAELDNLINRWDYNQNLPWTNLERYYNMIGSNLGQSTTSTQQGGGRTASSRVVGGLAGGAGGALAGYAAGTALAGAGGAAAGAAGGASTGSVAGPWGAVIGGLLGALAGAL